MKLLQHLFLLLPMLSTATAVARVGDLFYPFGSGAGDLKLEPNDDHSSDIISISMDFPFFDKVYSTLYVNNNGGVSFKNAIHSFTPEALPLGENYTFIAVFWGDVDTSYGQGEVYYREVTNTNLMYRITDDILNKYRARGLSHFKAKWAYIVTWYEVGAFGGVDEIEHNTFQLAILTDETHSFAIFNYGDIAWTYGSASGGISAQAGFNAGDGLNYFAVPGSRTLDMLDIQHTSNVATTGRWIFRIDQATISSGSCLDVEDIDGICAAHQCEVAPEICRDVAPAIKGCLVLLDPVLVENGLYVYFYCDINHLYTKTDGVVFEVDFLFDDEKDDKVPTHKVRAPETRAELHEKYLHGNLGKQVSCQVVSYFVSSPSDRSSALKSNSYFAGLQASESYLTLYEDQDTASHVYLKSTLPISCFGTTPTGSPSGCKHTFSIDSSENLVVYQPGRDREDKFTCQYRIDSSDWKSTERAAYSQQHPLYVYPTVSLTTDPPSVETITFQTVQYLDKEDQEGNRYTHMWNNYTPPNLTVYRHESSWGSGADCYSTGDPRITTFDGIYYDAYAEGQFVMVRSSSARKLEVHVRHEACSVTTLLACVCGLAIQEGNDTIILESCNNKPLQKGHRTASSDQTLSDGMKLLCNQVGNACTIQTPGAAFATIYINWWGMAVNLHIPSQDLNKTEGLCGTFDGNRYNDLKSQNSDTVAYRYNQSEVNGFVQSWRIPSGESLFERAPEAIEPETPVAGQYCQCAIHVLDEIVPCEGTADTKTYNELITASVTVPTGLILDNVNTSARRRRKRNAEEEGISGFINYDYDPKDFDQALDSVNDLEFFWPTVTGITEKQAVAFCSSGIRLSPVYIACQNHTDKVEAIIAKCVADVKVSSSFGNWAEDKLDELNNGCKLNILSENVTESKSQVLDLLHAIMYDVCPNQCSGHGQCGQSVCTCDEDYIGEDCSVDSSSLPNALALFNHGLCDTSERQCTSVLVVVENLLYTETLSCRVEVKESGEVTIQSGIFEGLGQVRCGLPIEQSNQITYKVSVSRNGQDYGEYQEVLVFDGTCLDCDWDGCVLQENSCSIDGRCYSSGDVSPTNDCDVCDPYEEESDWSVLEECRKDWTLIIVLAVLIPLILIVSIVMAVCIIQRVKHRKTWYANTRGPEPMHTNVYATTTSCPNTAHTLSVNPADYKIHAWGDKTAEGFVARHVSTSEGSFVSQPPVNHFLVESYCDKGKK